MTDSAPVSVRSLPPAYLLAGGQSRRFGSDKARVPRHSRPGLVWLRDQLLQFGCPQVTAVAREEDAYADLGIRTIADRATGLGPLAGLDAALADSPAERVLLLSCDLLEIRLSWLAPLVDAPGQAVVFQQDGWHPFPGCYDRSLLPIVAELLQRTGPERSFQGLFNHPGVSSLGLTMPDDWPQVASFNTPQELELGTGHAR